MQHVVTPHIPYLLVTCASAKSDDVRDKHLFRVNQWQFVLLQLYVSSALSSTAT